MYRSCLAIVALLLACAVLTPAPATSAQVSPPVQETCFGRVPTIVGAGQIVGTPEGDVILGSAGDDVIDGGGGNDYICAEAGNDTVSGGGGNDQIRGGEGADTISGGPGADEISGGDGRGSTGRRRGRR